MKSLFILFLYEFSKFWFNVVPYQVCDDRDVGFKLVKHIYLHRSGFINGIPVRPVNGNELPFTLGPEVIPECVCDELLKLFLCPDLDSVPFLVQDIEILVPDCTLCGQDGIKDNPQHIIGFNLTCVEVFFHCKKLWSFQFTHIILFLYYKDNENIRKFQISIS